MSTSLVISAKIARDIGQPEEQCEMCLLVLVAERIKAPPLQIIVT
jgi:hypothetical protein